MENASYSSELTPTAPTSNQRYLMTPKDKLMPPEPPSKMVTLNCKLKEDGGLLDIADVLTFLDLVNSTFDNDIRLNIVDIGTSIWKFSINESKIKNDFSLPVEVDLRGQIILIDAESNPDHLGRNINEFIITIKLKNGQPLDHLDVHEFIDFVSSSCDDIDLVIKEIDKNEWKFTMDATKYNQLKSGIEYMGFAMIACDDSEIVSEKVVTYVGEAIHCTSVEIKNAMTVLKCCKNKDNFQSLEGFETIVSKGRKLFKFRCLESEIQYLPNTIKVKGKELSLENGIIPANINLSKNQSDVKSEFYSYQSLSEDIKEFTMLNNDIDNAVNHLKGNQYIENVLYLLHTQFKFEYEKFSHKLMELEREVPHELLEFLCRSCIDFKELTKQIESLINLLSTESFSYLTNDFLSLQIKWKDFLATSFMEGNNLKLALEIFVDSIESDLHFDPVIQYVSKIINLDLRESCLLSNTWLVLRHKSTLLELEKLSTISCGYYIRAKKEWKKLLLVVKNQYDSLLKHVSGILVSIQPVNFNKFIDLLEKHGSNPNNFSGKDLIALIGATGVGKSSIMHFVNGATFTKTYIDGSIHYHPDYPATSISNENVKRNVKTSFVGSSETIDIIDLELSRDSKVLHLIDTPGIGIVDSRGYELDLLNSLNISAALRSCKSVKIKIVISNTVIGDRAGATFVDYSKSLMSMLSSREYVQYFSYLFTKIESAVASGMSEKFKKLIGKILPENLKIKPFWVDIATKTDAMEGNHAQVVDLEKESLLELLDIFFSDIDSPVLESPKNIDAFTDCFSDNSRAALDNQLKTQITNIETAIKFGNSNVARVNYLLTQMYKISQFPVVQQLKVNIFRNSLIASVEVISRKLSSASENSEFELDSYFKNQTNRYMDIRNILESLCLIDKFDECRLEWLQTINTNESINELKQLKEQSALNVNNFFKNSSIQLSDFLLSVDNDSITRAASIASVMIELRNGFKEFDIFKDMNDNFVFKNCSFTINKCLQEILQYHETIINHFKNSLCDKNYCECVKYLHSLQCWEKNFNYQLMEKLVFDSIEATKIEKLETFDQMQNKFVASLYCINSNCKEIFPIKLEILCYEDVISENIPIIFNKIISSVYELYELIYEKYPNGQSKTVLLSNGKIFERYLNGFPILEKINEIEDHLVSYIKSMQSKFIILSADSLIDMINEGNHLELLVSNFKILHQLLENISLQTRTSKAYGEVITVISNHMLSCIGTVKEKALNEIILFSKFNESFEIDCLVNYGKLLVSTSYIHKIYYIDMLQNIYNILENSFKNQSNSTDVIILTKAYYLFKNSKILLEILSDSEGKTIELFSYNYEIIKKKLNNIFNKSVHDSNNFYQTKLNFDYKAIYKSDEQSFQDYLGAFLNLERINYQFLYNCSQVIWCYSNEINEFIVVDIPKRIYLVNAIENRINLLNENFNQIRDFIYHSKLAWLKKSPKEIIHISVSEFSNLQQLLQILLYLRNFNDDISFSKNTTFMINNPYNEIISDLSNISHRFKLGLDKPDFTHIEIKSSRVIADKFSVLDEFLGKENQFQSLISKIDETMQQGDNEIEIAYDKRNFCKIKEYLDGFNCKTDELCKTSKKRLRDKVSEMISILDHENKGVSRRRHPFINVVRLHNAIFYTDTYLDKYDCDIIADYIREWKRVYDSFGNKCIADTDNGELIESGEKLLELQKLLSTYSKQYKTITTFGENESDLNTANLNGLNCTNEILTCLGCNRNGFFEVTPYGNRCFNCSFNHADKETEVSVEIDMLYDFVESKYKTALRNFKVKIELVENYLIGCIHGTIHDEFEIYDTETSTESSIIMPWLRKTLDSLHEMSISGNYKSLIVEDSINVFERIKHNVSDNLNAAMSTIVVKFPTSMDFEGADENQLSFKDLEEVGELIKGITQCLKNIPPKTKIFKDSGNFKKISKNFITAKRLFSERTQDSKAYQEQRRKDFEIYKSNLKSSPINYQVAFQQIQSNGIIWFEFDKSIDITMSEVIMTFSQKLITNKSFSTNISDKSIKDKVYVADENRNDIIAFMNSENVLLQIFKDNSTICDEIAKIVKFVVSVSSLFSDIAAEMQILVQNFVLVVPGFDDKRLCYSDEIDINGISRFQRIFNNIKKYENLIDILLQINQIRSNIDDVKPTNDLLIISSIMNEVKHIRNLCLNFINIEFYNSQTSTLVMSDKRKFYELVHFCYQMLEKICDEEMSGIINKIDNQMKIFVNNCKQFILEKNENLFSNYNINWDNILSFTSICNNIPISISVLKDEIHQTFNSKLDYLVNEAWLNESQWRESSTEIEKICQQLIFIKSIGMAITSYDDSINKKISSLMQLYKKRDKKDVTDQFIGKLGIALESSSGNGAGQKLVRCVPEFIGYKIFLQNLQFSRVGLDEVLNKMKCSGEYDVNSMITLRNLYERFQKSFWKIVENGLLLSCRDSHRNKISDDIKNIAQRIQNGKINIETGIFDLICNTFAYWSLTDMEGYDSTPNEDSTNSRRYILQPHAGQILVIFRLLGLDSIEKVSKGWSLNIFNNWLLSRVIPATPSKITLLNHFAEIKTGEGKSIVLAVLSIVLALLNFDVDIACYSSYLTERDRDSFKDLFAAFGIKDQIKYDTFKNLCENILDSNGNIRNLMVDTILGKRQGPFQPVVNGNQRHRVLLIDEVDVLFGSGFFGKGYKILTTLEGSKIEVIKGFVDKIWSIRDGHTNQIWEELIVSTEYINCLNKFSEWPFLIENCAKLMLHDVLDKEHKFDKLSNEGIGYFDDDNNITYNLRHGYKTMFAYIKAHIADQKSVSFAQVEAQKNILVNVATLSYAELPKLYSFVLGVTGTLSTLSEKEIALLNSEYSVNRFTNMPSAYPVDNTLFTNTPSAYPVDSLAFKGKLGIDILRCPGNSFYEKLVEEINKQSKPFGERNIRNKIYKKDIKRPVLVFFQNNAAIAACLENNVVKDFLKDKEHTKLDTHTSTIKERDVIIDQAVSQGRITFVIAAFGRGTDFCYNNKDIDDIGGIHVIQTFLSSEESEEIQIMGRTKRQGHPGSYSLVLRDQEFEIGGISFYELTNLTNGQEIHTLIKSNRKQVYDGKFEAKKKLVASQLAEHEISQRIIKSLYDYNVGELKKLIQERNKVRIEFTAKVVRTIFLIDGTMSMSNFFDKCKSNIKEIIRRVYNLLSSLSPKPNVVVEIQFVVYRNYNSPSNLLLQASNWSSDPQTLFEFIDHSKVSGGYYNEAIEVGLWHVNRELDRGSNVTQVILIGDMPPNTEAEIDLKRQCHGGESYWEKTIFKKKVFYKTELDKIARRQIPIHCFYLEDMNGTLLAQAAFEEVARRTDNKQNPGLRTRCGRLNLDDEEFVSSIAARLVENIQIYGGITENLYAKYVKDHPFTDIGFVK